MTKIFSIQPEFIDTGFGFPVHLLNVPMRKIRGIWTPQINYAVLGRVLLRRLALKPSPLTGNELKFIRHHFEMTVTAFASRFYVTHPAVLKWEAKGDGATGMSWSTEKDIRLFIYDQLWVAEDFRAIYQQLESKPQVNHQTTEIDFKRETEALLV